MEQPTLTRVAAAAGADSKKGTKPTIRHPAPPELADVALIDAPRIAAAACMSLSTWFDLVRRGEAPPPAIRAPRCTRWRLSAIRAWLAQRAADGTDPVVADAVVQNARRASEEAKKRRERQRAQAGAEATGLGEDA